MKGLNFTYQVLRRHISGDLWHIFPLCLGLLVLWHLPKNSSWWSWWWWFFLKNNPKGTGRPQAATFVEGLNKADDFCTPEVHYGSFHKEFSRNLAWRVQSLPLAYTQSLSLPFRLLLLLFHSSTWCVVRQRISIVGGSIHNSQGLSALSPPCLWIPPSSLMTPLWFIDFIHGGPLSQPRSRLSRMSETNIEMRTMFPTHNFLANCAASKTLISDLLFF